MARSVPGRTYTYVGIAIVCFVGAVALGINLLTEPASNRGDIGALIAALGGLLTATSLLWIRYAQKPPTS
jgi:drug/metabolite transporter superfamily protein YnfA